MLVVITVGVMHIHFLQSFKMLCLRWKEAGWLNMNVMGTNPHLSTHAPTPKKKKRHKKCVVNSFLFPRIYNNLQKML